MNIRNFCAGAVMAMAASFGASGLAQASVVTVTYQGTVQFGGGVDELHLFSNDIRDLWNKAYTMTFVIDTATPGGVANGVATDFSDYHYAGAPGLNDATFELQGVKIDALQQAILAGAPAVVSMEKYVTGIPGLGASLNNFYSLAFNGIVPRIGFNTFVDHIDDPAFFQPFDTDWSYTAKIAGTGSFTMLKQGSVVIDATSLGLSVDQVTVSVVSGVPEPATWLFMISGFLAIGARLRVDRKAASPISC